MSTDRFADGNTDEGGPVDGWVQGFLHEHRDELVALRRHLHAHPELSGNEFDTTELVAERLRAAGLDPHVLSSGTGLWCDVGRGERCVALRADIDGLAMDDTKEVPYRSRVPGVAHGCGHDVHTTIVLGAGLALAHHGGLGRVRLIFEPAEETVPGGALTVIADGCLDGVDAIFGVHCDPKLDVGLVGVRHGALTSAADMVEVTLRGPGGHTARPHLTVDLVAVAGRVAAELPARAQTVAGGELLVVFGAIGAGGAANVIPTTAFLRGSVRTPDRETWDRAESAFTTALGELVDGSGAHVSVAYTRGVPPVLNAASPADLVSDVARRTFGDRALVEPPRSAGGDTFSWYQEHVPGCYVRLGVHDPRGPDRLDLHSGRFDVDERALDVGVRLLVGTAIESLARGAGPGAP